MDKKYNILVEKIQLYINKIITRYNNEIGIIKINSFFNVITKDLDDDILKKLNYIELDEDTPLKIFIQVIKFNPSTINPLLLNILSNNLIYINKFKQENNNIDEIINNILIFISRLNTKIIKDTNDILNNILYKIYTSKEFNNIHINKILKVIENNDNIIIDTDTIDILIEFSNNKDYEYNLLIRLIKNKRTCDEAVKYLFNKSNYKEEILDKYFDDILNNCTNLLKLKEYLSANNNNKDLINKLDERIKTINKEDLILSYIINSTDNKVEYIGDITKERLKIIIKNNITDKIDDISIKLIGTGGYSRVYKIGDLVIKIGSKRCTPNIENNPYIISPIIREYIDDDNKIFCEVMPYVNTSIKPSKEALYQIYKGLRNIGQIWTDIKESNVGCINEEENIFRIIDLDYLFKEDEVLYIPVSKTYFDEFCERYNSEKIL